MKTKSKIRKFVSAISLGIVVVLSFWMGSIYREAAYTDACLDMGGGREPGGYKICVLALGDDTLRLGPIQITDNDVYDVTLTTQEEDISLLKFGVEKSLASVIAAYTKSIVGSELEIYLGDRLVNSVKVREAVNGTNMAIAMKSELAEQAYQSLNFASD